MAMLVITRWYLPCANHSLNENRSKRQTIISNTGIYDIRRRWAQQPRSNVLWRSFRYTFLPEKLTVNRYVIDHGYQWSQALNHWQWHICMLWPILIEPVVDSSAAHIFDQRDLGIIKRKGETGWWLTYPSEKWWSSSVGMMTFPIYGKIKAMLNVPNHQPSYTYHYNPNSISSTVASKPTSLRNIALLIGKSSTEIGHFHSYLSLLANQVTAATGCTGDLDQKLQELI